MIIRGEANNASIEFSDAEGLSQPNGSEYYLITIRENEFEVSGRVYAYVPSVKGLPEFFKDLAENWKGWEGLKTWSSLEGEFLLECQHDSVGHVRTTATLHSNAYGHGWTGQIRFDLAAGQLRYVAASVERFFNDRVAVN